jgi:hypothetical protein
VLTAAQRAELDAWQQNSEVNPKTDHAIKAGGPTHARLAREYDALRRSVDADEVEKANQKQRDEALRRDARAYARITHAQERRTRVCEGISWRARIDGSWSRACAVRKDKIYCRGCGEACRLSVESRECYSCQSPAEISTRCGCRTTWTVACETCYWEYSKPYSSFGVARTELLAYVGAVSDLAE